MGSSESLCWYMNHLLSVNNGREAILKEISHIYFPRLVVLNLSGNAMTSIEAVPSIQMPNLNVFCIRIYCFKWRSQQDNICEGTEESILALPLHDRTP